MTYGRITPEGIAALRSRMGVKRPMRPWNEVATKDAIRHWAHGIGDTNPLWTDEEVAGRSRYGCIAAPPTFLFTATSGPQAPYDPHYTVPPEQRRGSNLPGVGALHGGSEWEYYRPILVNDRITAEQHLADVQEKRGAFADRMVLEITETVYHNQRDELVGKNRAFLMRMERSQESRKGKYEGVGKHRWTPEELQAIDEAYQRQERRGATPRDWDDVQVGAELAPILKGPLTLTDVVCHMMGWGSPYAFAHGIARDYYRRHPGITIVDPETNVPDSAERIHFDDVFARIVGVPAAFDIHGMRVSWLGHLMTDWIGDDGDLRYLQVRLRQPNLMGDLTTCKGKVTGKSIRDGAHLVECDVWCENQRGEVTAQGRARAALPRRA